MLDARRGGAGLNVARAEGEPERQIRTHAPNEGVLVADEAMPAVRARKQAGAAHFMPKTGPRALRYTSR